MDTYQTESPGKKIVLIGPPNSGKSQIFSGRIGVRSCLLNNKILCGNLQKVIFVLLCDKQIPQ